MTGVGVLHFVSLIYLSGVICLTVSLNENRQLRAIVRETLRRWLKFLALSVVIALAVWLLSR